MGYRVSGILKLPDGTPANNAEIEFISRKNFSPLVQELKSNIRCGATGAYDVTLEYGEYAVVVYPGGTYPAALGTIILAADTVTGLDLPTLLQQAGWQPATPEYIQQIAQWLADANASAASSAASASAAKASENNAKASEVAAESDRAEVAAKSANVDVKHSEVVSKAVIVDTKTAQVIAAESVAVAAADTATQKAVSAAASDASAKDAAIRAESAADAMVGAVLDGGECNLSSGTYPSPVVVGGTSYSTVWFVAVAGTVSGISFEVGDLLRYTTANSGYYFKVDAKDAVYSVNGEKGPVTVTPEKIGAEVAGVAQQLVDQHALKTSAHQIAGVEGLRQELDNKENTGVAGSYMRQHEEKVGAHPISGVGGLQEALDSKYSPQNKPTAGDINAESAGTVANHAAQAGAHQISGVVGLREELDVIDDAVDSVQLELSVAKSKIAELETWPKYTAYQASGDSSVLWSIEYRNGVLEQGGTVSITNTLAGHVVLFNKPFSKVLNVELTALTEENRVNFAEANNCVISHSASQFVLASGQTQNPCKIMWVAKGLV